MASNADDDDDVDHEEMQDKEDWQVCETETKGKVGDDLSDKMKEVAIDADTNEYKDENRKLRAQVYRKRKELIKLLTDAEGVYLHLLERDMFNEWMSENNVSEHITREFEIYKSIFAFLKKDITRKDATFKTITLRCKHFLQDYDYNFASNTKLNECLEWLDAIKLAMSFFTDSLSVFAAKKGLLLTYPQHMDPYNRFTWKDGSKKIVKSEYINNDA